MQADLAECGRQKQLIRRVRDLEAAVAQQVGVSMVYSSSQLQLQPCYLHFLERLADGAATQGTVGWGWLHSHLHPHLRLCLCLHSHLYVRMHLYA